VARILFSFQINWNEHRHEHKSYSLSQRVSYPLTCLVLLPRTDTLTHPRPPTALATKEWERRIRLRVLLDTFIKDRNSYLFGLSNPQILDIYRLETPSGLRANQALSPTAQPSVCEECRFLYLALALSIHSKQPRGWGRSGSPNTNTNNGFTTRSNFLF
jgi:hypothetical protein